MPEVKEVWKDVPGFKGAPATISKIKCGRNWSWKTFVKKGKNG